MRAYYTLSTHQHTDLSTPVGNKPEHQNQNTQTEGKTVGKLGLCLRPDAINPLHLLPCTRQAHGKTASRHSTHPASCNIRYGINKRQMGPAYFQELAQGSKRVPCALLTLSLKTSQSLSARSLERDQRIPPQERRDSLQCSSSPRTRLHGAPNHR